MRVYGEVGEVDAQGLKGRWRQAGHAAAPTAMAMAFHEPMTRTSLA